MRRAIMVAALWLPGAAELAAQPQLKNGLMAIVNESVITYQDVERLTASQLEAIRSTYRFQPELMEQKRRKVLEEGLEQLVERQLVLDDFKSQGGVLPESVVEEEIRDRIRRMFHGDRALMIRTLQAQGKTLETLRQEIHEDIVFNWMRQRNISTALIVSPTKIEQYYQTNQALYRVGEQIKLRMIVLNRSSADSAEDMRALAQEILAQIGAGAPFAEMASIYSEGRERRDGGDWGWIERSKLNKGLSDVAFSLTLDQPSPVVALSREADDSYWISLYAADGQITSARKYTSRDVFVEERKNAAPKDLPPAQEVYLMMAEDHRHAHTRPLEEVRDQIDRDLLVQEHERLRKKWIERLKAKSYVRYF